MFVRSFSQEKWEKRTYDKLIEEDVAQWQAAGKHTPRSFKIEGCHDDANLTITGWVAGCRCSHLRVGDDRVIMTTTDFQFSCTENREFATLSLLAASPIVMTTTCGAASGDKIGIAASLGFECFSVH